jgi:hypothetical protein
MNRWLLIPAGCCLLAYVALFATIHGAASGETAAETRRLDAALRGRDEGMVYAASRAARASAAESNLLLTTEEGVQMLTTLSGEYLRPWRQWEQSPRHLYSRAAPRPIPPSSAEIQLAQTEFSASDGMLLAKIVVRTGVRSQSIPCAVDRVTKQVRLFSEEHWLTADEWLKTAPLP